MFALKDLYEDYTHQTPQQLLELIKLELKHIIGLGLKNDINSLDRCFDITYNFTNNHQLKQNVERNGKGEFIRSSGEPYINHTLRVALILVHEGMMDSNVIKAAIMHDLYEDTDYTYEQAEKDFNKEVADLINCVTNVSGLLQCDSDSGLTDEEIDYSNVINKCSSIPIAFFIKFADRYDNLMTLESMPVYKQRKKVADTRRYIYPLVDRMKATRFRDLLDDAIFSIEQRIGKRSGFNAYSCISKKITEGHFLDSTAEFITAVKKSFISDSSSSTAVRISVPPVIRIYEYLESQGKSVLDFTQEDVRYDIYIISDEYRQDDSVRYIAWKFAHDKNLWGYSICHIEEDYVTAEDQFGNIYCLRPVNYDKYNEIQYGNLDIDVLSIRPESIDDVLDENNIVVFTPKMDKIILPKKSTAVDFAYAIHSDLGNRMLSARVNGRNLPIYTELNNGDTVEILLSDKTEAQLQWVVYCETKKARRDIIKLFR